MFGVERCLVYRVGCLVKKIFVVNVVCCKSCLLSYVSGVESV